MTKDELKEKVDEVQGQLHDLVSELAEGYLYRHIVATDLLQEALTLLEMTTEHLCGVRPRQQSPYEELRTAVLEYRAAEREQTTGSQKLQVKGAARAQMLAKEQRRLQKARERLDALVQPR